MPLWWPWTGHHLIKLLQNCPLHILNGHELLWFYSNMRHSFQMETEQPTWLVMVLVLEREEPLLASYMRITSLAGKDLSGTVMLFFVFICLCWKVFPWFSTVNSVSRFSVSNDLKYDAERDLRDIGAKNIQVHSLNKVLTVWACYLLHWFVFDLKLKYFCALL